LTPEDLRDVVKGFENFKRAAIRTLPGQMRGDFAQSSDAMWNDQEMHAVKEAGQSWKSVDQIYHHFAVGVAKCSLEHTAMVHLVGLRGMKMLLASCSNSRAWRRIVCDMPDGRG